MSFNCILMAYALQVRSHGVAFHSIENQPDLVYLSFQASNLMYVFEHLCTIIGVDLTRAYSVNANDNWNVLCLLPSKIDHLADMIFPFDWVLIPLPIAMQVTEVHHD